jgi:UDP-glucose/iron transport system permease protein
LSTVDLTWLDLAAGGGLVLVALVISLVQGLGLERSLLWATCRTVVQLVAVGYVLEWIFAVRHPLAIFGLCLVMVAVAGRAAVQRSSYSFPRAQFLAFLVLSTCGFSVSFVVTKGIIGLTPWYEPRYLIPLLGMILGNTLTGLSLGMHSFLNALKKERDVVEMELTLGATAREAAAEPMKAAVKQSMVPIINSMMVVGLVSLPGMMTGQILAGNDPLVAVKYQILVMFMLAASTALTGMGMSYVSYRSLFSKDHQLLFELIEKQRS